MLLYLVQFLSIFGTVIIFGTLLPITRDLFLMPDVPHCERTLSS